jgi:hypothetical protein
MGCLRKDTLRPYGISIKKYYVIVEHQENRYFSRKNSG